MKKGGSMQLHATVVRWRLITYISVGVGLTLGYTFIRGITWRGTANLHTMMEIAATLLALTVGVMALVHFYSKKNNTFLFIGAGFLGTAFLDGYHGLITSVVIKSLMPSDLGILSPWSWVASRQFLSVFMFLSWLAWLREHHLGEAGRISERSVYLFAGLLTLVCFAFFAFTPLPPAYYPNYLFHRPQEFLSALFFLAALVGYLHKGDWRHDTFEHWLVLSLVIGFVGQTVFMPWSGVLWDMEFDIAHMLKKASYICVLTGLLANMYMAFRLQEERGNAMALMNSIVATANQSADISSAFNYCLAKICRYTGWEVGHVYIPDDDGSERLIPTTFWYLADNLRYSVFKEITAQSVLERGTGLPGLVFAQKQPHWAYDVTIAHHSSRIRAAKDAGLVGGIAFPIMLRDEVVAVFEFYSSQPINPDPELIKTIEHICIQISRVVERERSEKWMTAHRDHLQELVDSATQELKDKADALKEALNKEKELNELQRQFITMASHEFRTPLTIIDSAAQRLKRRVEADRSTPEDTLKRVDKIRTAVQRMTRLMESTLSLARMKEGRIKVDIGPCDIGEIVREACARQQEIAKRHIITCNLVDLPNVIQADSGSLEQVFTNLLSNAVKYAPNSPNIEVTGHAEDDHVIISVRDEGLGIDEDDISQIGERFFRAKTTTGIEGTGIGLNVVKALVEEHDGSLNVKSIKGEGSLFTIRLPISGPRKKEQTEIKAA